MTTTIHPAALKYYRDQKRWTQEQLAEATKGRSRVSLPTIKRIESAKGASYPANARVAEGLAKALGVTVDNLAKPPTDEAEREASLRQVGYRPLRTMLDAETALAFNMVQHIYGIPIHSQVVMAPLFAALLAEGSLAWRRERVAEIEETADRLMTLGGGHFSFANAAYRSLDGAAEERNSISKRDLFGEHVGSDAFDLGFDPSLNNPFADFLDHFARQVGAKTISFERGSGWKTSEGMPGYRIGAELISDLTGDDPDAEYALLRGYVRLKDIPTDLLGDQHLADRITWIVGRIPEEELEKRRAERAELLALLGDFDVPPAMGASDEREENGDA
ncbi:MAG: helix-turn-helix domain-containing protein [Labrys sp. (in: a-proteobacteria)]